MITLTKQDSQDHGWYNRLIREHFKNIEFTPQQEVAIKKLLMEVGAGYERTASNQSWGPGW